MIILVPVEGRRVLCPKTYKLVGPEGIKVEEITTFWHRRILSGDVIEKKEPVAAPLQRAPSSKNKNEKQAVKPQEGDSLNGDLV